MTLSMGLTVFGQMENIQREAFLTGLSSPVHITNAGDGSNRLFVVEQRGKIKVVQPGQTTTTDYLDLTGLVSQTGNERGLLGLAFHPDFENNGFFFVYYTRSAGGASVVDRYSEVNGVGVLESRLEIIVINQDFSNHNGGHIEFGPDNHLYIGMGDGGSGNDPNARSQDINSLLGKMLRITPSLSSTATGKQNYTIPADNPFVGVNGADEIYAIGLRNPYRWSFDRGGTNQLWAGDVGQNAIEEVSIITNGGNYGWRVFEGNNCTNIQPNDCNASNFDPPELTYGHSGGRCSITGGYAYRGNAGTFPQGSYIYGDFCTGEWWLYDGNTSSLIENGPNFVLSSFGQDEAGELFWVNIGGSVERIINTDAAPSGTRFDFDGDSKADISVFRRTLGEWWYLRSSDSLDAAFAFGSETDVPVPADFTGDGIADFSFWRPDSGEWFILRSDNTGFFSFPFGATGDIPAPGDFDGDGTDDAAVFRPASGTWFILRSSDGETDFVPFGAAVDRPLVGDYDGDGTDDVAVYKPDVAQFWQMRSTEGLRAFAFGETTDIAMVADMSGDGTDDMVQFRPSTGFWNILRSEDSNFFGFPFGATGDIPAPGDYDGDGTADATVFRPSDTTWYSQQSTNGSVFTPFGLTDDEPVPSSYNSQ